MSLIENEQAKLTATYVNGVAIAFAALGGIAPWIPQFAHGSDSEMARLAAISLICFSLSIGLHYVARKTLKRLKQ